MPNSTYPLTWREKVSKLTSENRIKLPKSTFAGPNRSYPISDKTHARVALARASEMERKGKLPPSSAAKIKSKANKKLQGK